MNLKSSFCGIAAAVYAVCAAQAADALSGRVLGYQLDVSRCKVPKQEVLYRMVDILSSLGYNQFQLYTEHTFAYKGHETVWYDASPMTPEDIRALDDYCAKKGIELVPNQNSFGHMEHWLRHPGYSELALDPLEGTILNPGDPRSLELVKGLYDQLLPCFHSRYFNVGCDEAEDCPPRAYCDFLKKIHAEVTKRGHTMMFWGDIVLKHPEFLPELPKDMICLDWGYGDTHPFEEQTAALEKAGMRFLVCPGTCAWGSLSGRLDNMLGNIDNAVTAGERHGAEGYLLADWGDGGYPQPWIVSLPAIVYLSHRAKGENPGKAEIAAEIDRMLGCKCGDALFAYGEVYRKCGGRMDNATELFFVLRDGLGYKPGRGATEEGYEAAFAQVEYAKSLADLDGAQWWVKDDFEILDLLYRAVKAKLAWKGDDWRAFRKMFEPKYRELWLRQNRRGGLKDSLVWLFGR
ncbi:MAG: beta-N-acetylhexosaminidase [Kiritimatiellae bacterium]|nr:beta-N-acetylhexosaminidase [Kiritimatiellia bacterium]